MTFTYSFAGVEEYTDCIESMKRLRDENRFDYKTSSGSREASLTQGHVFYNEYTNLKLQNICLDSEFQKNYKERVDCTNKLLNKYPNRNFRLVDANTYDYNHWQDDKGIMLSTIGTFNFCESIINQKELLAKIETCFDGLIRSIERGGEEKIFFDELGKYKYSFALNGYPKDHLLNICQIPKYFDLFTSNQYKKIRSCYLKKISTSHLANSLPITGNLDGSEKARLINASYYIGNLKRSQHTDLTIEVYNHCANSKVNNLELYKYYLYPGFVTCIDQTNHGSPINEREAICATVLDENDLAEIEKLSSAKDEVIAKAPGEVDNSETEEDSNWWSWLFGPSSSSSKSSQE